MKGSPLLSVVIPTKNRARRLADLLDSLAGQEPVPFEWEVIVVDNASADDTAAVVEQKSRTLPIVIRYVLETRLGLHQGRHRGAREARGDYLGYLDDDMILSPTWVQGVQLLVQGEADGVVGRILPKWEAEPPDWLLAMCRGGVFAYLGLLDRGTEPKPVAPAMLFGGDCFLPRKLVLDLGGFHPDSMPPELLRYRGDGEGGLIAKFKEAGLKAYYDPKATVYHVITADRLSAESLCKRAYNEGVSNSFTFIRTEHFAGRDPFGSPYSARRYLRRAREVSLAEMSQAACRWLRRLADAVAAHLYVGNRYAHIRKRLEEAHWAGWRFHQTEVRNDPALFKYVTRSNYLDEETDVGGQKR